MLMILIFSIENKNNLVGGSLPLGCSFRRRADVECRTLRRAVYQDSAAAVICTHTPSRVAPG